MQENSMPHPNSKLRDERLQRKWTQQDLADHLQTTKLTIGRWERGISAPGPHFRLKLCTLFSRSAEELGLIPESPQPATSTEVETSTSVEIVPSSHSSGTPVWGVPYPRNPHFTGRDELLELLAQQLSFERRHDAVTTRQTVLNQPQAVKGLGGVGKTQIAVEYAYRAREQGYYTHFLWINAASEETILIGFQTLAEQLLSFASRDEKDQHKLIAAVLRWLQACPEPWLLIVDNADELSLVQPYLPQQGQGSILLTTRATAVAWLTTSCIEVEPMGLVEGTQFLLHRTQHLSAPNEEYNEACNVVIALDGFPLALDQAGAYIEETGCSFSNYLQLYEQHRATLLARRGKQATNYPASVATTWSLSFQKIEQTHPAAVELLRLCAYLSPDHIPEELLTDGAAHWPSLLQQAVTDRFSFNELLEALLAFSLVKRQVQERLLSLHRLVQAVQMDRMDLQVQRVWAERVVYAVNTLFPLDPKKHVDTWSLCLRYLEQVQVCDRLIQQHGFHFPEAADLLNRAGVYLREHASYSLAEPLFQRAQAIYEQQLGREHLLVASPLNNLAILYLRQSKHDLAVTKAQQALHIREQALGLHHPEVAPSLNNLAILYRRQGKYEQAEPLLQRALHIWEQSLGSHHLGVAPPLNNLAILYAEQGKYELAEPLLQRALYIGEQALGPHHPQIAHPLNNLGLLYRQQGKYELAEPLLQRALHIGEQALGPHHPEVAHLLCDLGLLYAEQGKYELAEPLLQRALHIREQALGPEHPLIAEPLNGLANLFREQGQYEQADALYRRVLSVHRLHLGPQHIDIAETLQDLAQLRQMQQQPIEALSLYQQVLAIREQVLGTMHPKTTETCERLRAVLQALGKTEEAEILEKTHLDQTKRENGQETLEKK